MKIKLSVSSVFIICVLFVMIIISACAACNRPAAYASAAAATGIEYVAHAGGSCFGYIATNSMEAFINSAERGYNLIEVDILKSTDGHYILNHDWEYMESRVAFAKNTPVDYKTFSKYKIYNKFTAASLDDLIKFLDEYKNIRIITDTKDNDYSALSYIKQKYKNYMNRFIPQVYAFEDYNIIKKLGYNDIIITLYKMPYNIKSDAAKIYEQAKKLKPYAVTVPDELLYSDDYIAKLRTSEIKYFVHTINDSERAEELFNHGIHGVYTDNLLAEDYIKYYDEKIAEINESINELSEEHRDLLNNCLIYKYGDEICITNGKAGLIYFHSLLTSPFKNTVTQAAFLPLEKTTRYLGVENYIYVADNNSIDFEYSGMKYKVSARGFYRDGRRINVGENLVTLFNMFSVPDKYFTLAFDCNIAKIGEYIIVSRDKSKNIDAITEILQSMIKY